MWCIIPSSFSYCPGFFGHFESLAFFFKNGVTNLTPKTPKQSTIIFLSIFGRYNNKVIIFQKLPAILTKNEDKPNSRYLLKVFSTKNCFTVENCGFLDCFLGTKVTTLICGLSMWMIKITIKANQIDMDVLLISKVDNIQEPCLSLKSGFFH